MRILLICPVPIEFTSCRSLLALRDVGSVAGCRCARGSVAGLEAVALQSGPGKSRATEPEKTGLWSRCSLKLSQKARKKT